MNSNAVHPASIPQQSKARRKKPRKNDPCTAVFDCTPPASAVETKASFGGATVTTRLAAGQAKLPATERKNRIDIRKVDGVKSAVCLMCGRCEALKKPQEAEEGSQT